MAADPIFSKSDDPNSKPKLPPELAGKSPEEIMAYYQQREELLVKRAREIVHRDTPPPQPRKETLTPDADDKFDIFGDPKGSVERTVRREVKDAAERVSASISPGIIAGCKLAMQNAHPDWQRWAKEVEEAMKYMTDEQRMDPGMWEVAYINVRGRHIDEIANERIEASKRPKNPVEAPTPPGGAPPKDRELSDQEKVVAGRFEMSEAEYRDAANRYDQADGVLPFTYDSRKPKSKRKAS